ncbi:MAG: TatD family hydrolase [Bryobacteraceae bacterium]|nr:TatD family hydrolase [Bryobacteraceae bacterium]
MKLVDSHCHLDDPRFDPDRDAVVERALEAGVCRMLSIGSGNGPPDLEAAIRMAERYEPVLATVGVHPHDARKARPETWRRMEELLAHPKAVAVGEIGLDYYYDNSLRDCQREVFAAQLDLARSAGKPIIIHTRDAWEDTWVLLEKHWGGAAPGGVLHCFSGGPEEARRGVQLGFHLAFGGVLTFPKADKVRAAAAAAPVDRLLVETDAPYLAPAPMRGRRNEPAYVAEVVRRLAACRGVSAEEVAQQTTANFERLFRLRPE